MRTILLIFLTMLLIGCNKYETSYLTDEARNAFTFKVGSYWIYRDSLSGREDSLYVDVYMSQLTDDPEDSRRRNKMEVKNLRIRQKFDTDTAKASEIELSIRNTHGQRIYINDESWPFPVYAENIGDDKSRRGSSVYPEFEVDSQKFSAVYFVFRETRKDSVIYSSRYWFNTTVGFVKYSVRNENFYHIWELQRYHIVK